MKNKSRTSCSEFHCKIASFMYANYKRNSYFRIEFSSFFFHLFYVFLFFQHSRHYSHVWFIIHLTMLYSYTVHPEKHSNAMQFDDEQHFYTHATVWISSFKMFKEKENIINNNINSNEKPTKHIVPASTLFVLISFSLFSFIYFKNTYERRNEKERTK